MGRKPGTNIAVIASLSLLLCGCISALNVQSAEVKLYSISSNSSSTYGQNVEYARNLANEYIKLSDRALSAQDFAALGLIASAGVAAGGLLFDGNTTLLKSAGLAAGSITATTTYFRPGETGGLLLEAAEQLICISNVGRQAQAILGRDPEATQILKSGITTVRLNLRKKLQRSLPDYSALVQAMKGASKRFTSDGPNIASFQLEVANCIF